MKFTNNYIAVLLSLLCAFPSHSQKLIDKLGLYFAPGIAVIPGNENPTNYFVPRNAFGSFKPGLSLNLCLLYYQNDRISYGIDGQFFLTSKSHHVMYNTTVGPLLKYNFTSTHNTVSPFAIGALRFGYTYLNRAEYRLSEKPDPATDARLIDIQNLNLRFGYVQFGIPSVGATAGLGVDFKVTSRLKIFLLGSYTFQFSKNNARLKENYPDNKTNLAFITAEVGINYKLKKHSKKKNINNANSLLAERRRQETMKKIANASAKKNVTQHMPAHHAEQGKAGQGMKFKALSKEELDPNKKYAVSGQVKGSDGRKLDDVSVLLLDENGKVVATTKPDKNGRFAYKGLKPDNYNVSLNKNDPRLTADANVSAEEPDLKVDAGALNKFPYNRLTHSGKPNGIVMGEGKLAANGQPAVDETMLLLDNNGNVVAETKTNKDGKYSFRHLKSDNYQVVAASNPEVKVRATAAGDDPNLKIDQTAFQKYGFKKLANGEQPQGIVTGKINSAGSQKSIGDQSVLLLDNDGNVVGETKTNKEGRFAFKGLNPDNYQVVMGSGDPNVTAKANLSPSDPALQMPENAFFKFGKIGNTGTPDKFVTGKIDFSASNQSTNDATVMLIDDNGNVVETAKPTKDGNFVFKNVRAASYQVVVEGADYDKMVFDVAKNDVASSTLSATEFKKYGYDKISSDVSPQNVVVGKVETGGQALPSDGAPVILLDDKGAIVERTTTDKEGNFAFRNVHAANYQAVVEGQDFQKVTMGVANSDNAAKLSAKDFHKHHYEKLNPASPPASDNMIIGKINSNDPGKTATDKTVLLLDGEGKVVGKTVVTKNGSFTFNGLKPDNYQTVLEKPDPAFKSNLSAIVKDPEMKISMKDVYKFNPETKQLEKITENDHVVITGTIRSDDFMAVDNRTVLLMDDQGNVVKEVMSDGSGVFKFNGIKAKDYQVVYQSGDKKVNPTIQIYKDNDPAITEKGGKIAKTLFYGTNEYKLNDKDKQELEKFVNYYKEHPNTKMIKLNAYGDATGTDEANMEVTQKRAREVMDYLEKRGIPHDKLKLNPLGKSLKFKNKYNQPDPKLNRKVDIEIVD